jgi:hypothetical protein
MPEDTRQLDGIAAFEAASQRRPRDDGKDRKIAALQAKLVPKNDVVAELLQEPVQLKKELGSAAADERSLGSP